MIGYLLDNKRYLEYLERLSIAQFPDRLYRKPTEGFFDTRRKMRNHRLSDFGPAPSCIIGPHLLVAPRPCYFVQLRRKFELSVIRNLVLNILSDFKLTARSSGVLYS